MSEQSNHIMHLPQQLHTASSSVGQGPSEPDIPGYLITVNRHIYGKKSKLLTLMSSISGVS